ncbi:tetratricopeptide repeat protein [Glycomyces arizonensis]|uniref:tetratricopeptide repeat protein n=1 Tax=Glycomyces arizonensis TaxID=256035 RepID=UPI000416A3DF|nr:tetratricopeptide repeat protein [Glycomyces arizonensis]
MRNGVARGRVLGAVAKAWPGFIMHVVEARAREHVEAGRFGEAAVVMEEAVERYGPGTVPPLLLAWVLVKAGRPDAARDWALRAVEDEPENPDAHWVLSGALFDLERGVEAADALRKAVELSPENGSYYMELAWIRYREEDFGVTRELVDKALELAPDDAWVQYTAGRIFDHHLRHRRAQSHYERALELDPENAAVRYDLGALLQTRGRISRGVVCVYETAPEPGGEAEYDEAYGAALLRWPWRWYEWALRAVFVINIADWVFPTPPWLAAPLAGLLVAAFAVRWGRTFASLPAQCRRDMLAPGRRGRFTAASVRTLVVLAGAAAFLLVEPGGWQHLGVLAVIVLGYADWYRRAVRIAGN